MTEGKEKKAASDTDPTFGHLLRQPLLPSHIVRVCLANQGSAAFTMSEIEITAPEIAEFQAWPQFVLSSPVLIFHSSSQPNVEPHSN
jgi:hypothetical protein